MEESDPIPFRIHICDKGKEEKHFHILVTDPITDSVCHPSHPMWDMSSGEIFIDFLVTKGILLPSAKQQFLTLWAQRKALARFFPKSLAESKNEDMTSRWLALYRNGVGRPFYLGDDGLSRILLCSFVEFPGSHAGLHEEKLERTLASDCYPLDIGGKRVLAKIP